MLPSNGIKSRLGTRTNSKGFKCHGLADKLV